ncbi:hypothetical protein CDAR_181511 [Caerostris darwini]|uniref:Nucleoporin NUP42 n=1 Tax=Caerostris darwini TaxID=1538125 RepID=A0AAV4U434_9ARAC|nr:hypothetical protein CDAR_181511 [Caerostris darwini]
MTICRYFLQGNCRFGDRCRFEHTDPYSSYNEGSHRRNNYDDFYNRPSYESSNRINDVSTYDNRSSYRYASDRRNDYNPRENQYHSNYNQNVDYQYNRRYHSSETHQQRYPSTERYGHTNTPLRYESDDYSHDYSSRHNTNKNEWVSNDYRKPRDQKIAPRALFNSNVPQSATNFSFKDPEVQRKDRPLDLHMNEQNLLYAEIMKEDMSTWEGGSQWPFSCYSLVPERANFPGFVDLSPEELRCEAYKARENNTYNLHVESVEKALKNIKNKRDEMKAPSIQLMSVIEKYRTEEDVSNNSVTDGLFPFLKSNESIVEDMVADAPSTPKHTAASFSFKSALDSDGAPKRSASNFSFKTPDSKPSPQEVISDIYTALDTLSAQDREQYSASTFTIGKIPTVPPPKELCF